MRASLKQVQNLYGRVWEVDVAGSLYYFADFEGARKHLNKKLKRLYKESAAYSMARTVEGSLLSCAERDLVRKLCKSKCSGITPKQYGYLKGIHERQQREW